MSSIPSCRSSLGCPFATRAGLVSKTLARMPVGLVADVLPFLEDCLTSESTAYHLYEVYYVTDFFFMGRVSRRSLGELHVVLSYHPSHFASHSN